jgi:septum formation protein
VKLILASASPRRAGLLAAAGYQFDVLPADIDEVHLEGVGLVQLTRENAGLKAWRIAERHPDAIVLGADTLVSVNGCALGKPADLDHARAMLRQLSGRPHHVCTAVCLASAAVHRAVTFEVLTTVRFRTLTDADVADYLSKVNPLDKAGAYGIQDHGEIIIAGIEGSYSNVMGLPMERLHRELDWFRSACAELHPGNP